MSSSLTPHRTEVDCGFQVLDDHDGGHLLQLSTFGSDERKSSPKVSQTLQIDATRAEELIGILRQTFPGASNS